MGFGSFIGKIKGAFAKEPEIVEEIDFSNIDKWLEQKYSSKEDFLNGQLAEIRERIKSESLLSEQNIESLRNAQLRNENIPAKAKHFMQGNRETYMRTVQRFFENIELPNDAKAVAEFISSFDTRLDEFSKSTARAYAILREFFEVEASRISANIKNVDNHVGEIKKSLRESNLRELNEVRQEILKIKSKISHKEFLLEEIGKKEGLVKNLSSEKARLIREVHAIENSAEYKDMQMLKQRLEEARKFSAEKEAELKSDFASLERPLKKYERIAFADRDLIAKYIISPTDGLSHDFGFKIIGILGNMKRAIVENKIELKDKQKIKAVDDIKMLDKEYLGKFVAGYAQLRKKENDFAIEIKKITVEKDLAKLKEELDVKAAMLDKARKDLEGIHQELGKIDIESMKKELAENAGEALGMKTVIS